MLVGVNLLLSLENCVFEKKKITSDGKALKKFREKPFRSMPFSEKASKILDSDVNAAIDALSSDSEDDDFFMEKFYGTPLTQTDMHQQLRRRIDMTDIIEYFIGLLPAGLVEPFREK